MLHYRPRARGSACPLGFTFKKRGPTTPALSALNGPSRLLRPTTRCCRPSRSIRLGPSVQLPFRSFRSSLPSFAGAAFDGFLPSAETMPKGSHRARGSVQFECQRRRASFAISHHHGSTSIPPEASLGWGSGHSPLSLACPRCHVLHLGPTPRAPPVQLAPSFHGW